MFKMSDSILENKAVPVVSICCLTYNHESFIEKALDGMLMQKTDFRYEILIHDDASTDSTVEIVNSYITKYPDIIKPIFQKINQRSLLGGGMNPRFNFPRAKGLYIAICEGDDYWTDEHKLQKQVDFLDNNQDYSICFHNVYVDYYENVVLTKRTSFHENKKSQTFLLKDIVKGNFINTCSVMYRRDERPLPDYFKLAPAGDWVLNVHFSHKGKIYFDEDIMSVYRIHDGGMYQHHNNWSLERHIKTKLRFIELRNRMLLDFTDLPEIVSIIKNKINDTYYELVLLQIRTRVLSNILKSLRGFLQSGFYPKNWARMIYKLPKAIVRS
jgi:glycosyltransferase involved in cell wall biosynthesis